MYHHYAKTMKNHKDSNQDIEIAEQFIREYCTRTELETKARDAALLLLKQLEECRNPSCICKKEEHKEEEPKPVEEVGEEVKEETKEEAPKEEVPQEEKEEPVISDEKFQKLQNTRQGKKSYREYLRNQLKVIGLAGIIAMSTAAYAQSQVVYKNGAVVYVMLEKEFPILTTIKNFIVGDPSSSQSQNETETNNTPTPDNNSEPSPFEAPIVPPDTTNTNPLPE